MITEWRAKNGDPRSGIARRSFRRMTENLRTLIIFHSLSRKEFRLLAAPRKVKCDCHPLFISIFLTTLPFFSSTVETRLALQQLPVRVEQNSFRKSPGLEKKLPARQ